jgi:hypothetical protein
MRALGWVTVGACVAAEKQISSNEKSNSHMGAKLRSGIDIRSATDTAIFRHRMRHELGILPLAFYFCTGTPIKRAYEAIQTMCMIIRTNNRLNLDRIIASQLPIWQTSQLCITHNYEPVLSIF